AFAPSACPPIPSTTTSSTAESLLRTSTRSWLSCRLPGRLSLAHSVRTTIFWCLRYVARAFRLEMTPGALCGRPYRISAEYYAKWTSRCPVVYMLVRAARVVEPSSVADRLGSATPRSAGTDRYLATQHDWLRERRGARSAVPTHLGAAQRQSPLSRSRYPLAGRVARARAGMPGNRRGPRSAREGRLRAEDRRRGRGRSEYRARSRGARRALRARRARQAAICRREAAFRHRRAALARRAERTPDRCRRARDAGEARARGGGRGARGGTGSRRRAPRPAPRGAKPRDPRAGGSGTAVRRRRRGALPQEARGAAREARRAGAAGAARAGARARRAALRRQ